MKEYQTYYSNYATLSSHAAGAVPPFPSYSNVELEFLQWKNQSDMLQNEKERADVPKWSLSMVKILAKIFSHDVNYWFKLRKVDQSGSLGKDGSE